MITLITFTALAFALRLARAGIGPAPRPFAWMCRAKCKTQQEAGTAQPTALAYKRRMRTARL